MKLKTQIKRSVALFLAFIVCVTAVPPMGARAAKETDEMNENEYDWRLQQFGGNTDISVSDNILKPTASGDGFTLEYGKLTQEKPGGIAGSVAVYNAGADSLENSILEFNMQVSGYDESFGKYQVAIFPRFVDGRNCDGIAIGEANQLQHSYQVGGSEGWPGINNPTGISFKPNQVYAMKIITLDNKIEMYVDGAKVAETDTHSTITEGKYGFRIWGDGNDPIIQEKKVEITDVNCKELKNSSVDSTGITILSDDWGAKDIKIPITLDNGDKVASVKNGDTELIEEIDYEEKEDHILIDKDYIGAQEGSFHLDIIFDGGADGRFQIKKYEVEGQKKYIWETKDGIDAWEKISGNGTFEMEADGLRLKGENKLLIVDPEAFEADAGEIEIIFDQKNDEGRMGFLFRADKDSKTWQSILHAESFEYARWHSKTSSGGGGYVHGDGSFLFSRSGLADTKLKVRYYDNIVTLWMDDYIMYSGDAAGLKAEIGTIGVSTESVSDILLKKVVYRSIPENYFFEETDAAETIEKGDLSVLVAKDFPRVIEYDLNGNKLYGSEFKNNKVTINAVDYPAQAVIKESNAEGIVYEVTPEEVDVVFEVAFTVLDGNVLDVRIQNIDDSKFEIRSIAFPNQPLLSANSKQPGAKLDATVPSVGSSYHNESELIDQHLTIGDKKIATNKDVFATLGFISTDKLSASITNNVLHNLKELRYRAYTKEDGSVTAGFENNDFMYRGLDGVRMFEDEDLYCQIVITEDTNGDAILDWQDGANALKTIVGDKINGGDKMADSFVHVGYNFASQVQNPFLKVADNTKRLSNYIDGFDQILVFKGYANEGHDSAHADYDDINKRAGGAEDMQRAAEILEDKNSVMGIHINHTEAYPEAKMFNDEVMSTKNGWSWLDQSKFIRRDVDILKGGMDQRLDSMFEKVPGIGFVYVDTYGDDRWPEARLAKNLVNDHNVILGTETQTDFDRFASWVHWPGIGDGMHRFVYHQQKDVYKGSQVFRGGYNRSMSYMSWQHNNNIHSAVEQFYSEQLPQKYLMNHDVRKWTGSEAVFEGNVRATNNKIYKDDNLIADGGLVFVPWFAEDSLTKNPDEAAKIYHWNPSGGATTWTLPSNWQGQTSVKLYQTTQTGKELMEEIDVVGGQVTIEAKAKTPYVIYKGDETITQEATEWSVGSPIEDTSFNSRDFSIWKASSSSDSTEHIQINDNNQGIALLTIEGEKDGEVSQTMTGLIPGQKYRLSVWAGAENGKTARLIVDTPDGKTHENYTENTPMVCRNLDTYAQDKKVQRVWVDFIQPEGESTAVVTLAADASDSSGKATFMETRIVKTTAPDLPNNYVAWEDFEHTDQGFGIFAPEGREEYSHLTETHLPYTDNTINGDWSMQKGTTMRTQPSTARMEPNTDYYLDFNAIGSGKVIVQSESDGTKVLEETYKDGSNDFAFTTGDKNDFIVRLEGGWIIDDFEIYLAEDPVPPSIPENVDAIMTDEGSIKVTWNPSTANSKVKGYNVYRDNELVAYVKDTVYIDKDVMQYTTYTYEVTAINSGSTESERSEAVKGYYGTEMIPLTIESAELKDAETIEVKFNRTLDVNTVGDLANYHISEGVEITAAELLQDGKTVSLTVTGMSVDKTVILTVKGIKDMAGIECDGSSMTLSALARYYKFDEDSLETAYDFMGIEDGKKTNVGIDNSGYSGNAASFTGNSRVQLSKDSLYNVKEWTLSAWIYWNGGTGESQTIMGNGVSGDGNAPGMWFHIRNDKRLWASPYSGGVGKDIQGPTEVPLQEWTHVAISFNADEEFVMYMNGKEEGRVKFEGYATDIENLINIGCNINTSGAIIHKLNASMDELKIYQTALSADEIKAEADETEFLPSVVGNKFIFDKKSDDDLMIRVEENGYELTNIEIDGNAIVPTSYEVKNHLLTIQGDELKKISDGDYTLTMKFDKSLEASKTISVDLSIETKQTAVPVDKSELYRLISIAGDLSESDYVEGWGELQTVLTEAISMFENKSATHEQVNEAADKLQDALNSLIKPGDKSELAEAVEAVGKLKETDYTVDSWKALAEAMEDAKAVLDNANATQDAVDEALADLQEAMEGLVNKAALQKAVTEAEELDEGDYTAASWTAFADALKEAKTVLAKTGPKQDEVDTALAQLEDSIQKLEGIVPADKITLEKAVAEAEKLNEADYTEESWAAFKTALETAKGVLGNDKAAQAVVDLACTALEKAMDDLKKPGDKSKLEEAAEAAGELKKADYTVDSWNVLEEAMKDAQAVLDNVNATQDAVDEALADLREAMDGLVNKAALQKAVTEAEELDKDDYTAASWTAFADALREAKTVLAKTGPKQDEVDTALAQLEDSILKLEGVAAADKNALEKAVAEAEKLNEADYTEESWAALKTALETAKGVLGNDKAAQVVVDLACTALEKAMDDLVKPGEGTADKKNLEKALKEARTLKKEDYVLGWTEFSKALTEAETVFADEKAGQDMVDTALAALKKAMGELQKVVKAAGVSLNHKSLTMIVGDQSVLSATVSPGNTTNNKVNWKSSNTGVAGVSATGAVKANKAGTATITATAADGSGKTASCTVKIYNKTKKLTVRANGYTLNQKKLTLQKGKKVTLKAKVATKDALPGVTYKTNNKKVATVSSKGVVKGKKAGTAKITITSKDEKYSQTYTVKVVAKALKADKITSKVKRHTVTLNRGKTYYLPAKLGVTAKGKKADQITSKYTYRSKNSKIAKVNKAGEITGKKKGRTTIIVKNGKAKKEIKIVVK